MPVAVARVVVACPRCQQEFQDWWRPTLDPAVAMTPALLDDALPTQCPSCHAVLDWTHVEEDDGIFHF